MQIIKTSPTLYKRDTKGKIRVWYYEVGTDGLNYGYRITTGIQNGKLVTSNWLTVEQKNVGKANETSLEQQANLEAEAELKKKSDRGYFDDLSKVDSFDKFKPMLANEYKEVTFPVYSQPKLDGIRCIARKDGLWTRAGKPSNSVPHIVASLANFFEENPDAILDGELYSHKLKDDFNKITSIVRKEKPSEKDLATAQELEYHVYDYPSVNLPFVDRFSKLKALPFVVIVPTVKVSSEEELNLAYEGYLEAGYEGQMVRLNALYENKRSKSLLKRKQFITSEFPVIEVQEGKGNWEGYAKRFVLDNDPEFAAGVRGNQEHLKKLLEQVKAGNPPTWATVRYFTPTPDNVPRFPVVIDWGIGERQD